MPQLNLKYEGNRTGKSEQHQMERPRIVFREPQVVKGTGHLLLESWGLEGGGRVGQGTRRCALRSRQQPLSCRLS